MTTTPAGILGGVLRRAWALLVGLVIFAHGVSAIPARAQAPTVKVGSQLVWTPPTSGAPETYVLSCGTASGNYPFKTFVPGSTPTATISGAMVTIPGGPPGPGQEYVCIVQAQNLSGTSAASNEAGFRFPEMPAAPTNLRVVP